MVTGGTLGRRCGQRREETGLVLRWSCLSTLGSETVHSDSPGGLHEGTDKVCSPSVNSSTELDSELPFFFRPTEEVNEESTTRKCPGTGKPPPATRPSKCPFTVTSGIKMSVDPQTNFRNKIFSSNLGHLRPSYTPNMVWKEVTNAPLLTTPPTCLVCMCFLASYLLCFALFPCLQRIR